MWDFVQVVIVGSIIFDITGAETTRLVQLQMTRVEPGMKTTSGIVMTTELRSASACILHGVSFENAHAVNYDASTKVCEIISMHGSVLEMHNDANYIFAALNNTKDLVDTGVRSSCDQGAVQWKEQATWHYTALENVLYTDEAKKTYVCKATVGDNEIPGVVDTTEFWSRCNFIYKGLTSYSGLYRTLVVDPDSGLAPNWMTYGVGEDVPAEAFVGGRLSTGTPLYVCRAQMGAFQYTGYYNPNTAMAYIHSGLVRYPTNVDLLIFSPSGPNFAGPTAGWPCPRYHVQDASPEYEYIEHHGRDVIPSWAITTSHTLAVGKSAGAFDMVAKFDKGQHEFQSVYGIKNGGQTWGRLLKTSLPFHWESFEAGSDVPYNAFLGAYTIENDPLYIVKKHSFGHGIGTYNPRNKLVEIEYFGIVNPTSVHILTLSQPPGSSAWSDAGYNTYSGPITALRIQHGNTVTGIQCRFGAQWSAGFWANGLEAISTHIDFKTNEFLKGVNIGLSDTLDHVQLFTNLDAYGPFGRLSEGKIVSMFARCGQVHHLSGYLQWNERKQINKTYSFAVHGDNCM